MGLVVTVHSREIIGRNVHTGTIKPRPLIVNAKLQDKTDIKEITGFFAVYYSCPNVDRRGSP
jgi:hypothetical protein